MLLNPHWKEDHCTLLKLVACMHKVLGSFSDSKNEKEWQVGRLIKHFFLRPWIATADQYWALLRNQLLS